MDERHSRHRQLPGWDQARLAEATVVIAGMGALGNAVAQSLALAGVGKLLLCDPDQIERSNLSRTPLFREQDVGRYKVEAAGEALRALAPGLSVRARVARLEAGVGLAELRDASLVLGCLDSRAARLELAGRCGLVGAPWIDGATGAWSGEIRPYLDPDGPCYGCGQDPAARAFADAPLRCGEVAGGPPEGAAAPIAGVVGAQMAVFAVRFLMGLSLPRHLLVFDAVAGTMVPVQQGRDPACPYHQVIPGAECVAIGPRRRLGDLLDLLGQGTTPLAWNPVRLGAECRGCGYADAAPQGPSVCPRCAGRLRVRTTLELTQVAPDLTLAELGIPPREILACRQGNGIFYIELEGD